MEIIWPARNEGGRCLSLQQGLPFFTILILPSVQSETRKEDRAWQPRESTGQRSTEEVTTGILEQDKGRQESVMM